MAKAKGGGKVNKNALPQIDRLIEEFSTNKFRIGGQFTIDAGHDYWWILEYGSSPATPNPDPSAKTSGPGAGIVLKRPMGIPLSKRHRKRYRIVPNPLFTKRGKPRALIFNGGRYAMVKHPGIKPRAIIRVALWKAERRLSKELGKLKGVPSRSAIVKVLNKILRDTLKEIKHKTPEGVIANQPTMRHSTHLRDAYGVVLAE